MFQLQHLLLIILGFNYVVSVVIGQGCNTTFNCGNLSVSYPFWRSTTSTSTHCGYPAFGVNCTGTKPILTLSNRLFAARSINYSRNTLAVVDVEFMEQTCPTPNHNYTFFIDEYLNYGPSNKGLTYFSNCSSYPPSVPYISCFGSNQSKRSYVFENDTIPDFNWYANCEKGFVVPTLDKANNISNVSGYNLNQIFQEGFEMEWTRPSGCQDCEASGGKCGFNQTFPSSVCFCSDGVYLLGSCPSPGADNVNVNRKMTPKRKILIGVFTGVGSLILIILFVYWRKLFLLSFKIYEWCTKSRKKTNVDVFLESYGRLTPHRYRYSELKRITNRFNEKLGQGGYGSVFKGKLDDGRFVAVKMLIESKDNGENFINEVAIIGMTNHINIVSLIGFCYDGPKRALVYEFMPNGSLEKFVHNDKSSKNLTESLGFEKLYEIALGIANGIEYLHRGCNMRILHLDIKPHNVLLDEDFCPKISDFGLAKLCPTRESVLSMTKPRGTIGYIAPEVYCRDIGGVSPKSDVYSYGVMVLEMVGGRKNMDATVENATEIYFPHWAYNHLNREPNTGSGTLEEIFEVDNIRKMIIVGLWCIQIHPANRPSMSMVVEKLQKSAEDLQIPPNPFQDLPPYSQSSS